MSTVTERVAAGAAYLDEHDPGWWRADVERAIDLATLNLERADLCILGQRCPVNQVADSPDWVHHDYDAMALTFGDFSDREQVNEWAAPLGFQVTEPGCTCDDVCDHDEIANAEYADLTAEWRRVIEARRAS